MTGRSSSEIEALRSGQSARPSVAVAVPAYNEADGIAEFLREIDAVLLPHVSELTLVVVDDASTDGTAALLEGLRPELRCSLELLVNQVNRGHGPSLLRAYRRALETGAEFVLAVDGDGQFHGLDLRRVLVLLADEAHAVCGVRRFRQDPWFRMVMTRLLRSYVRWGFGVGARDPNCPLRGYQSGLLRRLLGYIPDDCLIPNLYLTVVASRIQLALLEVDVSHRVRRGVSAAGTTWSGGPRSVVPWHLVRFSFAALRESRRFRSHLVTPPPVVESGDPAPGS